MFADKFGFQKCMANKSYKFRFCYQKLKKLTNRLFIQKYAATWTLSPLNVYLTYLLFLPFIMGWCLSALL